MEYICNAVKSPEDKRDYIYIGSDVKLPEIVDYRDELKMVRNQGKQGSCYAQSVACVKEYQEKKDYGFNRYFSPQFFYNNRTNLYDDNTKNDSGMYSRDVMKLLSTIGICTEESYPYGKIEDKKDIKKEIYEEAKSHTIKAYAKVNSMEKLKRCLFETGPCLIAFPSFNYTDQFFIQRPEDTKKGGHAVTVVGYNKEGFILRNSWGFIWGDSGYTIYKYQDWGIHWEIWCVVDEKTPLEKIEKFKLKQKESNNDCCIIS